jgi:tRNA (guanine37-N1)-methyltransferase
MLLTAAPIYNCWNTINKKINDNDDNIDNDIENITVINKAKNIKTVYMSPKGAVLTQKKAEELAEYTDMIVICGHYEGVDERVLEETEAEEISVGDFILTGGELPCAILVDCVARLVGGVLSDPECHEEESISSGLLECPQYTKPFDFMGRKVPEVLLSGHHANIEKWRREQSLTLTAERRPDLLEKNIGRLDERDIKFLRENNLFFI